MTTAAHRTDKINKLYKVVKKHFQPVSPPSNRTVIEHLLYGCCLENSTFELADEVFARLQQEYFDWNEVRVTTTAELAEVMKRLPEASEAANRIRKSLHGLFEAHYSFDLEFLKKENLGKAIEQIEKYRGVSPFCIGYLTQSVLGGHSIPVDEALMKLMVMVGIVAEEDVGQNRVTGLERTIPKNKGIEFFSLVHQLAVAFHSNSFNKDVRGIVLEIDPEAQERFPRRGGRKKEEAIEEPVTPSAATKKGKGKAMVEAPATGKSAKSDKAPKAEKTPAPQKPTPVSSKITKAEKQAKAEKSSKAPPAKKPVKPEPKKKMGKEKPSAKKPALRRKPR